MDIKIGDVVWLPIRESFTKTKVRNNLTSIGQHTVINVGQNPFHKASCKRLQNKWSETIHKEMKIDLIYRKNVKQMTIYKKKTTTTGLQVPGLGHKVFVKICLDLFVI